MIADKTWIVCQLGARENYSVARALHRRGRLAALVTDFWIPHRHPLALASKKLSQRYHEELKTAVVVAPNISATVQETTDRVLSRSGWAKIMAQNEWFQRSSIHYLNRFSVGSGSIIFAYSYAAGEILGFAKNRGALAILGQIDPGPVEARLVASVYAKAGDTQEFPPPEYWTAWRREIDLADVVVVNSRWSMECLVEEGVAPEKIRIVPLAYETAEDSIDWLQPSEFNFQRPLSLLFLGQVTRRKGADILFEAMERLPDAPIRLDVVGPIQMILPQTAIQDPRIIFHGGVTRGTVLEYYARADVFVFPTRSDGFGLTQLEAMAAGVPVVASRFCGDVVRDKIDGFVLDTLDGKTLASLLLSIVHNPAKVAELRANARLSPCFGIERLGASLDEISQAQSKSIQQSHNL